MPLVLQQVPGVNPFCSWTLEGWRRAPMADAKVVAKTRVLGQQNMVVFQYYKIQDSNIGGWPLNSSSVFRYNDEEIISHSRSIQDTTANVRKEKEFCNPKTFIVDEATFTVDGWKR